MSCYPKYFRRFKATCMYIRKRGVHEEEKMKKISIEHSFILNTKKENTNYL